MATLDWDDRLKTGDAIVDKQHVDLHALVVELGDLDVVSEKDRHEIEFMLFKILRYAAVHFADEEALMERIGFNGLERQRRLHAKFACDVTMLAGAYVDGSARSSVSEIQSFMYEWLLRHVMEEDMLIAEYIRASPTDITVRRMPRE